MQQSNISSGSVTQWIADLRNGDPDAASKIWTRFVDRLRCIAKTRFRHSSCRVGYADEVVTDAFVDFFKKGPDQFESLVNRVELWQILVTITERRVIDVIRKELARKRGSGNVRNGLNDSICSLSGLTKPPDVELMMIETFSERLEQLNDEKLSELAIGKMEGLSNLELAMKHGTSLRSIERKLSLIRKIWIRDAT